MSIRVKLIITFTFFLVLSSVISVSVFWMLSEIEKKIVFLEIANSYMVEIQQARRFEKNFFLYGTNLNDASEHVGFARAILFKHKKTVEKTLGNEQFKTMNRYLNQYDDQLAFLQRGKTDKADTSILRESGRRMIKFAEEFVQKERQAVSKLLKISKKTPVILTGCFIVFLGFLFFVFMRQLIHSLNLFMLYTKRIGEGDFSPIQIERTGNNEFGKLAEAFNQMVRELNHRYEILVESQKLRAVGTLVAGVAHELNNPLNNTMLTASILKEEYENLSAEDKKEMFDDLIYQTERSQRIVRDLLDFARENKIKMQPLNIAKLLKDSVRLVENQMKLAKVQMKMDIEDNLPMIHGDEQMLKQVFINLVLNAVDALPPKGMVKLSVRKNIQAGYLAIQVLDNGPGIPDHIKSRIFEPFFTTKSKDKGVGLGLSVSMGIIKKHEGFINVTSDQETGTCFNICLPITELPSKKMMKFAH